MITFRTFASYAALSLLVLLPACGGEGEGDAAAPAAIATKQSFQQDVPVRQLLPPPTDSTWKDQETVQTPIKVGADSLPVMVVWTPTHRGAHRAISRIDVAFPEHPASDSLSASIAGAPVNHGTTAAIVEGLTLQIRWTRSSTASDQLTTTIVHLKGDGTSSIL